jgi:hypothetical protein
MPSKSSAFLTLILLILAVSSYVSEGKGQGGSISGRVYARNYLGDYVPAGFATILVEGEHFETIVRTLRLSLLLHLITSNRKSLAYGVPLR